MAHTESYFSLYTDTRGLFEPCTLTFSKGQITSIVGESGSGKTTLLRIMCGLDPAKVSTSFQLDDVMYMHQLPTLLPWLTVYDNIRIPNQLCRHDTEHLDKDIHHLLEQTSLLDVRDAYPHHLSVGMQQRVCFVRTLVSNRPLICLDEPFSSLDPDTRYMMHRLLASTMRDRTFILVTHDCLDVMRLAHRAYVIRKANQTACISPLTLPPFTLSVPRPYTYDTMGFSMTSEV